MFFSKRDHRFEPWSLKTDENRDDTEWRIVTLSILFQMGKGIFSFFFLFDPFRFVSVIWAPMIPWIFRFLILLDLMDKLSFFFFLKAIKEILWWKIFTIFCYSWNIQSKVDGMQTTIILVSSVVRIVRDVTSLTDYNIMHVGRVVIVITSKHVSEGEGCDMETSCWRAGSCKCSRIIRQNQRHP